MSHHCPRTMTCADPISVQQRVYVLTLKTWVEWDRPHHTYGRIHWSDGDGYGAEDSESLPDAEGITTIRHETREEAIAGAREMVCCAERTA